MLFTLIIFILLGYVAVNTVNGATVHGLLLDNGTCPYKIYELDEHEKIQVQWDGRKLPDFCEMSFIGKSETKILNRYKVCVVARTFDIDKCDFTMKYFNGFTIEPAKEYNCQNRLPPPKFCANESKHFEIKIEAGSSSSSTLTLVVTATVTYEENNTLLYVGLSFGGVSCIAIIGVVLFIVLRRKKQKRNQEHTTTFPQSHAATPSAPPYNPYVQTGQGVFPAHVPLPTYSESFNGEPKLHPLM